MMVLPDWAVEAGDFIIGCGFLFGMILMNVPQHYLCWKYRSAEGLSLAYILICTISNVTLTLASLMGDYHVIIAVATNATAAAASASSNSTDFLLFDDNTTSAAVDGRYLQQEGATEEDNQAFAMLMLRVFATLNACMPTLQNFTSILVGVPSLIFYYFWFDKPLPRRPTLPDRPASQQPLLRETSNTTETTERTSFTTDSTASFLSVEDNNDDDAASTRSTSSSIIESHRFYFSDGTEYRLAKIATIFTWLLVVIAVVISFFVLLDDSSAWETSLLQIWGSIAAITNMVLFIPQIATTWRNQHEGVLSLASLLVSVIGDLAIVAFWIVASGETVWVYAACVADAGMQMILIVMIIDFRKKRARERAMAQVEYDFVYDNSGDDHNPSKQGEIEVVYGEVLDMYQSTTSALESLWDTQTMTPTTHGSMDYSSRSFLV